MALDHLGLHRHRGLRVTPTVLHRSDELLLHKRGQVCRARDRVGDGGRDIDELRPGGAGDADDGDSDRRPHRRRDVGLCGADIPVHGQKIVVRSVAAVEPAASRAVASAFGARDVVGEAAAEFVFVARAEVVAGRRISDCTSAGVETIGTIALSFQLVSTNILELRI